jgi:hypothetical protein
MPRDDMWNIHSKRLVRSPLLLLSIALFSIFCGCGNEAPENQVFELLIRDQSLLGENQILTVKQNDIVTIVIKTKERLRFHLHGYDIEEVVLPTKPATLKFTAEATGSFPFTAHFDQSDDDHDHGHSNSEKHTREEIK